MNSHDNNPLEEALVQAADNNNLAEVKHFLERGANPNARGTHDMTALHLAVRQGNHDLIELLAKSGADLNAKDHSGWTPLHWCVFSDFKQTAVASIALLTKLGAHTEVCDEEGLTPMHWAFSNAHPEMVMALVGAGGNLEAIGPSGRTPFLHALMGNRAPNLEAALWETGANLHAVDFKGQGAIHYAISTPNRNLCQTMAQKGVAINLQDNEGNTPLMLAAKQLQHDSVSTLLAMGADCTLSNYAGEMPLDQPWEKMYSDPLPGKYKLLNAQAVAQLIAKQMDKSTPPSPHKPARRI